MKFEDKLKEAIKFLENESADLERSYGGGGYDPSEATRVAGKIDGIKFALGVWERSQ